jgi:hypothetical protein
MDRVWFVAALWPAPVLVAAPLAFAAPFFAKMVSKLAGRLPTVRACGCRGRDRIDSSLMRFAGLTFGQRRDRKESSCGEPVWGSPYDTKGASYDWTNTW